MLTVYWEDNKTPPGFVVVHDRPHELTATLACQSVTARLYMVQLLAHGYQQPASDVQIHHQRPACTSTKPAQSNATNTLAISIKIRHRKKGMDSYVIQKQVLNTAFSSPCCRANHKMLMLIAYKCVFMSCTLTQVFRCVLRLHTW